MEKKKWNINSPAKLLVVLIAVLVIGGSALTFAMIDDTNSVHINAEEIEDSTLIVGTHLIYLGAMTDQIYAIASDSASESGQYNRYYKSELAGGVWYDVTNAGTLADITTSGKIVQDSEIEELNMTHHTKSDGVTYDLRTNKSVCVFDIKSPYDLEGMEELEPLKLQYDLLTQEDDPTETNERDMKLIEEIYNKDRSTEETKKWDQYLYELQIYYEVLVRDGADTEMSDMVMTVMEKVDATRRTEILNPLQETELQNLNQLVSRDYTYVEGEVTGVLDVKKMLGEKAAAEAQAARDAVLAEYHYGTGIWDLWSPGVQRQIMAWADEAEQEAYNNLMEQGRDKLSDFSINTELISAIGEALSNVQDSYTENLSIQLEEGTTVLSKVKYETTMELLQEAAVQDFAGCDEAVTKLLYLDRIENSIIREEDAERGYIAENLLPRAEAAYTAELSAGESEVYQTLPSTAAAATKANALKQQKNDTEVVRNELQFIIRAYVNRMPTETAMEHISQRIEDCANFRTGIKEDAYAEYANSSVDAHLAWLTQLLTELQDSMGNRTMDDLMSQKQDLQTERMTALDQNKLSVAKKLDVQIAAVDQEMQDLENHLNDIIQSSNTSASEKAQAAAQLGSGNTSALLQNMKNDALNDLRDGNLDGIGNIIDAIGTMSDSQPKGALGALKDIYQELSNQELMGNGSDALNGLLTQVEEVTAEQMSNFLGDLSALDFAKLIDAYMTDNGWGSDEDDGLGLGANGGLNGSGNGSGSGSGNGNGSGNGLSGSGSPSLQDVMGRLSDAQLGTVLSALDQYAKETNSADAKDIVSNYSRIGANAGNDYIFDKLRADPSAEYIPTDRVGKICKYRYIFNDSQKAATLQKGSEYYRFTAFSPVVDRGGATEDLSKATGFQTVIYIPADAAETYFDLSTHYLENASYGILLDEEMRQQAVAFLNYLLEAGGEA